MVRALIYTSSEVCHLGLGLILVGFDKLTEFCPICDFVIIARRLIRLRSSS